MKSLSMRFKYPPSKQPESPPKNVIKTSLDPEISIDYLNCSYTNKNHLQVLIEKKEPKMSDKLKAAFAAMDLMDQLHEVITNHTPSELKMVYMQICGYLSMKHSEIFSSLLNKGRKDSRK